MIGFLYGCGGACSGVNPGASRDGLRSGRIGGSGREALAPFCAPFPDHVPPGFRGHSLQESVFPVSFQVTGLKCSLRHVTSLRVDRYRLLPVLNEYKPYGAQFARGHEFAQMPPILAVAAGKRTCNRTARDLSSCKTPFAGVQKTNGRGRIEAPGYGGFTLLSQPGLHVPTSKRDKLLLALSS